MNNLFIYWVGKEYKLIKILRNLMKIHSTNGKGYKLIHLNRDNISEYIDNIPDYFDNLLPAHQADFVRVCVIRKYGGIWMDSDTLVLDSLDSLFDIINKRNGFFIKENDLVIWNGVFGSKKETPLMIQWEKDIRLILDKKKNNINWAELGCDYLDFIYNNYRPIFKNYVVFSGKKNMYPINWNNCVNEFINKPYNNYKNITRKYQPFIVLVNSVYKALERFTEKQILNFRMPLNYFINKSFENNRKIIYLKIAKNAGTSMVDFLKKQNKKICISYFKDDNNSNTIYNSEIIVLGHQSNINFFKNTYKQLYESAHKIILFRNPVERLISSYNYLKLNKSYEYYLNNRNINICLDKKNNYNAHYIHFDTSQFNACDFNYKYFDDKLYNISLIDDYENINNIFSKLNLNKDKLNHLNKTDNFYKKPDDEDIELFKKLYMDDINIYNELKYYIDIKSNIFIEKLNLLNKELKDSLINNNYEPLLIGNLFYDHLQKTPPFYNSKLFEGCKRKRIRLYNAVKDKKNMFEVGTNGGHSSFLALISNNNLNVYSNDIASFYPPCPNTHPEIYVPTASNVLKKLFPNRFTFIRGDCLIEIPNFVSKNKKLKFDIVHIDGAKNTYKKDFLNLIPLLDIGCLIIFDDTQQYDIQRQINELINEGYLKRVKYFPIMDKTYQHRNDILEYIGNNKKIEKKDINTNYNNIFSNIYKNSIWNNNNINIPLSGPGSSLNNTKLIKKLLEEIVIDLKINSIVDLGCGDLTWMPFCNFFNSINYIGIDIVNELISSHKKKYPSKEFICKDIVNEKINFESDLVIIRDVIFHLKINDVMKLFNNIRGKFKYILITSCRNNINNDIMDQYHYSKRNIKIEPFNCSNNILYKIYENIFDRDVFIYKHDNFYTKS